MHSSIAPHARSRPRETKSKFVSFPARSAARDLTAKSALLLALKRLGRSSPGSAPLVAVSVTTPGDLGLSPTLVKRAGRRTIQLDLGNNLGTIQSALMGDKSRCLDELLLKKRTLYIDEAYLHDALKPWEKASATEKVILASTGMDGERVVKFSVNFGDRGSTAGLAPDKILRRLRNELVELGRLGSVVTVVEKDPKGRDHLHGWIQTSEDVATVKSQLWRLGGGTSNYRFRNLHQLEVVEGWANMGWCHYLLKDIASLPAADASKRIYMSKPAKQAARQALDELSWVSRRRLLVTPERRGRANVYRTSSPGAGSLGRKVAA